MLFDQPGTTQKPNTIELNGDLSTYFVEENHQRIESLKAKIIRLTEAAKKKSADISAAKAFFEMQ